MTIGYSEFISQLQDAGYKTTKINTNRGEADFSDYGNALSDELQSMITDSFDCEQDLVLQSEIAALFGNRNYMQMKDFGQALKAAGYTFEFKSIKSTYIPDNKGDGHYDTDISTAGIGVYTISDGKGGEIVIADANGNGALEIEEVFMNQILEGVAVDVEKLAQGKQNVQAYSGSSGSSSSNGVNGINGEDKKEISQTDYNSKVEEYLKRGHSLISAELRANSDLNAENMNYTGAMQEITEEETDKKEKEETEITAKDQSNFNKDVEALVAQGFTLKEALQKTTKNTGLDLEYTGSEKLKEKEENENFLLKA